MQGIKRKIVYVSIYEAIAIGVCSIAFALLAGGSYAHASVLSALASAIAVVWNFLFTTVFEAWERRQVVRGRSVWRRVVHAVTFECGLIVLLVPLIAWWMEVSLLQALLMDLMLAVFFLVYTFIFNWIFDRVFGLPESAL